MCMTLLKQVFNNCKSNQNKSETCAKAHYLQRKGVVFRFKNEQ